MIHQLDLLRRLENVHELEKKTVEDMGRECDKAFVGLDAHEKLGRWLYQEEDGFSKKLVVRSIYLGTKNPRELKVWIMVISKSLLTVTISEHIPQLEFLF